MPFLWRMTLYEYYVIGWCYELQGDNDKALEYFNQGIDLDKTYSL